MRSLAVAGTYYRVADPDWDDPLDAGHAAVSGQRWNPPGVACLYLNDDIATARSNIVHRFAGLPYGPEDLEPAEAPVLIVVEVPAGQALDAVSDEGLTIHSDDGPLGRTCLQMSSGITITASIPDVSRFVIPYSYGPCDLGAT